MKNLKLSQRLIGAFMIMALIVGITGAYGALSMKRVGDRIQDTLKNLANQQKQVLIMAVTQKTCYLNLMQAAMVRSEKEKFEEYVEDYRMKADQFKSQADVIMKGNVKMGIKPVTPGSELEKKANAAMASWTDFESVADELIKQKETLLAGVKPGVLDQAAKDALADGTLNELAQVKLMEASDEAKQDIDDMLVDVTSKMNKANEDIRSIQKTAGVTFVIVVIAAIVLAAILGIHTARNIIRRIERMAVIVDKGAEGDLTAKLQEDSNDELGKLCCDFNQMVEKLAEMIGKVTRSSSELTKISERITDAACNVVNAAQVQAEGVSNTSSAMSEINASIKEVAHGVDSLSLSATESSSSILEMAASIEEVALNVESLSQTVEEVSSSIVQMAVSIKQIGNGVVSLMEAANTTATSVMEMDSSIKQVEQYAVQTASISEEVRKDAETGKAAVEATIAGINEIKRSSLITSEVVDTLSTKAEDIGDILSVIDEVAEQTNLLALNAAIIAAQAGEHGKGFAVVADEIKELAERTSSSTREISQVIKGVQDETRRAVEAISQAERSINDGEVLSQRSGEALTKIVGGVQKATEQVNEIAQATVEQAKGSQMIRIAMEQVSEMVEQIAKATREQGQGTELIMGAVERMKSLAAQVRGSTREQSKVGNFISKSTENITGMIQQIKRACDEQRRGSEQVVFAVEDIQQSTNVNVQATQVMNESAASLFHQIELLQKETGAFKVAAAEEEQ
jgi:methyl-accepting chemotaxis protein